MSFREFLKSSSLNEAFSAQSIRKGGIYLAKESGAKDFSKADKVKVLSVVKDSSGDYDVKVEFLETGERDSWYLYKTEKIFQHINEAKTVDIYEIGQDKTLSTKEKENLIKKAYPYNLTYQGKEFFESIYLREIMEYAYDKLKIDEEFEVEKYDSDEYDVEWVVTSGQESYLGYVPSEDIFINGWDMSEDDHGANTVSVKIKNGKATTDRKYGREGTGSSTMYPNGYKAVHRKYKDIIDIRLD